MKKKLSILLVIFVSLFFFHQSFSDLTPLGTQTPSNKGLVLDPSTLAATPGAIGGGTTTMGVTPEVSLLGELVYTIATYGIYLAYKNNFQIYAIDNNGTILPDSPNNPAVILYRMKRLTLFNGMETGYYRSSDGSWRFFLIPPALLRTTYSGDNLCVTAEMGILGFQNLGCLYIQDPKISTSTTPCYVAPSCQQGGSASKNILGISGIVVQCLHDTIGFIFSPPQNCTSGLASLGNLQDSLRSIVGMLLVLYVVFYGIKIALTGAIQTGEAFMFVFKMLLVLYFSVGLGGDKTGLANIVWPFFSNGSAELSSIMLSASSPQGSYCTYSNSDYAPGQEYLAFFDTFDCKILMYMGIDMSQINSFSDFTTALRYSLIGLPIALIISFQILYLVLIVVFVIFLISLLLFVANVFCLSLICLGILIYLGPIFIPFALFNQTKSYFDNWLKQVISFSLQPVVIVAYISLILSVFDNIYWGDCSFGSVVKTVNMPSESGTSGQIIQVPTNRTVWNIINSADPSCANTFGYMFFANKKSMLYYINLVFFSAPFPNTSKVHATFGGLSGAAGFIEIVLFAYLFVNFAEVIGKLAGDITGSGIAVSNMAVSPTKLLSKAGSAASAGLRKAFGKKGGDDDKKDGSSGASASGGGGGGGGGGGVARGAAAGAAGAAGGATP